ncbi:hypothetical protein EYC80_010427 [Monilinia laxa]|uniref:Uncharacterized protein n=1 Tax=Monilinia laxa TaxID=61186 RepID=A0A5N6JQV8_MONLA|nr:hypothetical protein EYC80_010427 [Monilinia laxa]
MYDPSMTMTFATRMSLGEDEDLKSIVEKAAIDFAERDKLRRDLRYYFGGIGNSEIEGIRESVGRLIDQEIMDRDLLKKDWSILKRNVFLKAGFIAADIERKRLGVEDHNDGHDFVIQLMTLIDGWGQGSRVDLLKFNLDTSFLKFVNTLKDETRNSKIPPESIIFPSPSWPFVMAGDEEVEMNNQTFNNSTDTQSTNSSKQGTRTRDSNDKGYSLLDGPWMYRLPHIGKDEALKPGWKRLMTQSDYMNMLDGITHINSRYTEWKNPSKCSVMIMHSQDRDSYQRYLNNREEERTFSIKWEKELEEEGFFDDEDISGEPGDDWFDYWKRIATNSH